MMSIIHPIASGFLNCPASISSSPYNFNQVVLVLRHVRNAYIHFSLHDSFLADEGASLPKVTVKPSSIPTTPDREAFEFDDGVREDPHHSSPMSQNGAGTVYSDALEDESPALTCLEESPKVLGQELRQVPGAAMEYNSHTNNKQSILVSFSSYSPRNRTVCERFRLLDIKSDSWSNKPLARYLQEYLFDQTPRCSSCKESTDAHIICYTHWLGKLTIKVRHADPSAEQDGKMRTWNVCPKCTHVGKVIMSDADLGITFGKFLEHSFSNYGTANCVASCGHSLQDCVRCYGFGSMVAFFHYSAIDILSVRLPPPVHELSPQFLQEWLPKEAAKQTAALDIVKKVFSKGTIFNPFLKWFWLFLQEIIDDVIIPVYDDEPTSIISCAVTSKEYKDCKQDLDFATQESSVAPHLNCVLNSFCGCIETMLTFMGIFGDVKSSPHSKISFEGESSSGGGKLKFSVTSYFAVEFSVLRRNCCIGKLNFVHSLSRCRKWNVQGGKSNVYFARSRDERFIIKQVTKTEFKSFEKFAPKYFEYVSGSLNSGNPTCLAKILGIYQVTIKHLNGGKDTKMNLLVMENLFFGANISRTYDLKGSERNRYNTPESNNGLLDMNFWEAQCTDPIFLGSDAKRSLEIAVRSDASFLASVGVVDYSLLVGVDKEKKEVVIGIIDFLRQYTCDKLLETWAKASGILGGPIGASPTIIPPNQYKERFIKAMTAYFPTMPHNGHQLEGGDFVNLS